MDELRDWAYEQFGKMEASDGRHRRRVVDMVAQVAKVPRGTVAGVFNEPAERQAAYDLLSNRAVSSDNLLAAVAGATARRCRDHEFVFVPIDGTGITLSDQSQTKPLGSIGKRSLPTRGIHAIDALAVAPDGTPIGLLDVQFWARGESRKHENRYERRKSGDTEMRHWNDCIEASLSALEVHAPGVMGWIVMDRESDEARIQAQLVRSDARFTIRANQNRVVEHNGKRTKLFHAIRSSPRRSRYTLDVPSTPKRQARRATVDMRATRVKIKLPDYVDGGGSQFLEVNVVEIYEPTSRKNRVHWVLLTNAPIDDLADVAAVVASYRMRWRIEEFHRTWKSGGCGLEEIQLRTSDGIRKWAIMLGTVATRTERLKHLARTDPDAPATVELHEDEIRALILAKRQIKNRVEQVPDEIPTIEQAVKWIAQLGGYAGEYKKGARPGSTTIARGLIRLAIWTDALRAARLSPKTKDKMR